MSRQADMASMEKNEEPPPRCMLRVFMVNLSSAC